MATIKPVKGAVSWNKSSGMIQASGLAPPAPYTFGVGDKVLIVFEKTILCGNEERVIGLYTTPELELKEWRCVPNGWVFAARTDIDKDVIGEFRSIFKCLSAYNSLATDQDLEDFLDRLTLYSSSNVRESSTPYADPSTGWWSLSDITGWNIPGLANIFVQSLSSTTYISSASIINSYVPLMGQLFLSDGFNKVVSMIPSLSTISDGTENVATATYLDLRDVNSIDLMGSKGNPEEDPRADGPGKVSFLVESVDNDDSMITYIKEEFTGTVWFTEASKSKQTQSFSLLRDLGPAPIQIDPELEQFIKDLIVTTNQTTYWTEIRDISFDYNMSFFNEYNHDNALFILSTYSFVSCYPSVNPYLHMSSIPSKTIQLTVRENDAAISAFMGIVGASSISFSIANTEFNFNTIQGLENDNSGELGSNSVVYRDFEDNQFNALKYSITEYKYRILCSATPGGNDSVPYLLKQEYIETKNYQAGPFLLNMDSKFWVTPDAGSYLGARDPQGVRVWLGPFDDPKRYAFLLATIASLHDLFDQYGDQDAFHNTLCSYSMMGYLLKESDIVVAAICKELSYDAPQAYIRRYDEYISTVKNWFDGMMMRLSGLNYSFKGAHGGLTVALDSIAKKQGTKVAEIYERLLPGTTIANLDDAAGGAYCKEMLRWIASNGIARLAFNTTAVPSNPKLVRPTDALLESTNYSWVADGAQHLKTINYITGDITTVETPVAGHPEYVYISPRYTQLSTITESGGGGSNLVVGTKVMDWARLFNLKNSFESKVLGRLILSVSKSVDYTDNPEAITGAISSALSDIAVRTLKLTVSGEGNVLFGYNYLAYGE